MLKSLQTLLLFLTRTPQPASTPGSRRANLLAWLLIVMLPLLAAILPILWFSTLNASLVRTNYFVLIVCLMALLGAAYIVNRRGNYSLAAALVVACAIVGPWVSVYFDPSVAAGNYLPLVYITLSIFLASILLSARMTILIGALELAALSAFALSASNPAQISWASLISFVLMTIVLSVVSGVISRLDVEQISRQARELEANQQQLREMSIRDPLTGLYNRRHLNDTLERELARAARQAHSVGVIMLDIDYFKQFNDAYGHVAGDGLLRDLGRTMPCLIRDTDTAYRYGGEEFVIILPDATAELAFTCAQRLHAAANAAQIFMGVTPNISPTISFGVAAFPRDAHTPDDLLGAADAALYHAKRAGRNRVVCANSCV